MKLCSLELCQPFIDVKLQSDVAHMSPSVGSSLEVVRIPQSPQALYSFAIRFGAKGETVVPQEATQSFQSAFRASGN